MRAKMIAAMAFLVSLLGACASDDLIAELPDAAVVDAAPACQPIVFLNRQPATFYPGEDDAVANQSSIVESQVMTTGAGLDDATWQSVAGCVSDLLEPFEIIVTDADPGELDHIEVAFTVNGADIGYPDATVSSLTSFVCPPVVRRGVAFELTGAFAPAEWGSMCRDVGEMIGHFAGIDHSFKCEDAMSWLVGCGQKAFLDEEVPCGEYDANSCECTGLATQNTFQLMTDWFGAYCGGGAQ